MWIGFNEINNTSRRKRISIGSIKFFPSHSSINLHNYSSILFVCLSNAVLIMF
jgi:hypothetical protein